MKLIDIKISEEENSQGPDLENICVPQKQVQHMYYLKVLKNIKKYLIGSYVKLVSILVMTWFQSIYKHLKVRYTDAKFHYSPNQRLFY